MVTDAELEKLNNRMGDTQAPDGTIFVCSACGKTSVTRYGLKAASPGWDESCMMHCLLVRIADITEPAEWKPFDRVLRVK